MPGSGPAPVSLQQAWQSGNFERLRTAQRERTWDDPAAGEPICQSCAVTKQPTRLKVQTRRELKVVG
jgi:hypothetical protein